MALSGWETSPHPTQRMAPESCREAAGDLMTSALITVNLGLRHGDRALWHLTAARDRRHSDITELSLSVALEGGREVYDDTESTTGPAKCSQVGA